MNASQQIQKYFAEIKQEINKAHTLATECRKLSYDPDDKVESVLAENMAERVVGLLSTIAPQIINSGIAPRVIELEKQYGILDWRVAFKIAEETANEKYCKFKDKKEAMEIGIRLGFAYLTLGTVSSPLDGFLGLEFKKRLDNGKEYFCLNFAGPIRNAGGTAAAVCVLIADYIRRKMNYDVYDATEDEIKRTNTELQDYHERITNLQYVPSKEEIDFLMKKIPVQIGGDPSEKIEVSNFKDLPRIQTNLLRSGFCLILSSCIPLKAPKIWNQLGSWGKEFEMDQWNFLEEYLKIQKTSKAKGATKKSEDKISPDYTFIADLVAGRPVLGYPLRVGGFRLRYGRSRISGYSGQSIHPATKLILNRYIATGTQLKVERPGKAASLTSCDMMEGPIVKLIDDSVVQIQSHIKAKTLAPKIKEILFLGDILISYGDFFNRAHPLVPAGYCEEWWIQEFEKAVTSNFNKNKEILKFDEHAERQTQDNSGVFQHIREKTNELNFEKLSELLEIPKTTLERIHKHPLLLKPSADEAIKISKTLNIPLHPTYTYYWSTITQQQLIDLVNWFAKANLLRKDNKISKIVLRNEPEKRIIEQLGIPHSVVNKEFVVVEKDHATILYSCLDIEHKKMKDIVLLLYQHKDKKTLELMNMISQVKLRDKAGIFVGARMGRPEKAKQRKLTGSPHSMFPVGEEGGRLRSVQSCLEEGTVTADFAMFKCEKCKRETVFRVCEKCNEKTQKLWHCASCGFIQKEECEKHGPASQSVRKSINITEIFKDSLNLINFKTYPNLIKGVRGTSNKEHIAEHICKGILRAKNDIHVNKDGTTRYDMTQLPMTHFKPKETGTPIQKLISLGYEKDILGNPLTNENQVLELKPQDIVLPECSESTDEGCAKVLFRVANFVDDLLINFYKTKPFYCLREPKDLIGHLAVCLAPHTSAGIVGRIIGFTQTQGFFAHPMLHAATRRDCDGDEACVILLMDNFLNFSKKYLPDTRGATMDAPLVLTSEIDPTGVDDMLFDVDIPWRYPLEFYEATLQFKSPKEVKIPQVKKFLGTPQQYEGYGFTHDVSDLNNTVRCSAYKTLPSMEEKVQGQMDLAEKIRAVNARDVAQLVIEKHFIKDTKGNLRKFSTQEFRCVSCNTKFRRPPLIGKCTKCNGKLIFTVSEGNIIKYLEITMALANKYDVPAYLKQTLELLQKRIEGVFGRDKEKQSALAVWAK